MEIYDRWAKIAWVKSTFLRGPKLLSHTRSILVLFLKHFRKSSPLRELPILLNRCLCFSSNSNFVAQGDLKTN